MSAPQVAETNEAAFGHGDLRWGSGCSAIERLFADASRFSFYQAVRVLSIAQPDAAPRLQHDSVPVRFRSSMGMEFPGSDIDQVLPAVGPESLPGAFPEMLVSFLGLAGAHGPLPAVFTEQLLREKKTALRDFLNIFNHRLILLMYRVHEMHHPALTPNSPDRGLPANHLYSFFGLGRDPDSAARHRLAVPDRALLDYSGLLAHRPHSACGLQRLIGDYFQVETAVEQFIGAWLELSEDQWTRIGARQGRNNVLGDGAILGRRVWDQHAGVTIRLGPLYLDTFESFLPDGSAYQSLRDLTRFYLGDEIDYSFKLELRSDQIPWSSSSKPASPRPADAEPQTRQMTLGRLAWLKNAASRHGAVIAAQDEPAEEEA
jgi:type VI secretion system protein ImpH